MKHPVLWFAGAALFGGGVGLSYNNVLTVWQGAAVIIIYSLVPHFYNWCRGE